MKNIYLSTLLLIVFSLSSCVNEDYIKYDESNKDAVYLDVTDATDSTFYNFGFESIDHYQIDLKVNIMGKARDYERKFKVVTDNERYADAVFLAAAPEFYTIPEYIVVPKNAKSGSIPIVLKRDKLLETQRAIITVELVSTDDFDVRGHSEFTITFDDKTPKIPAWWQYESKLGTFTKAKYKVFLSFFWAMEQSQDLKYYYDLLVEKFGRELNKTTSPYDNPFIDYPLIMKRNVHQLLYDYQQAHPTEFSDVSVPTF